MYEYPCKNKIELELEEGRRMCILREGGLDVINVRTPGAYAAAGGQIEYRKEWYKSNKEKKIESVKQYQKANKEKISEYKKNNKEKISKRTTEYYKTNKEKISEYYKDNKERKAEYYKNKPRYQCECCNKEFNKSDLNRHKKSAKYIRNMKLKQINDN
jgi:tRNA A37 N6-isopentenylltransferase MiaA